MAYKISQTLKLSVNKFKLTRNINNTVQIEKDKITDEVLRCDLAGEVAAVEIYRGQMLSLGRTRKGVVIKNMYNQEKEHVKIMNEMVKKYDARQSYLTPLWRFSGFSLGFFSGLLGKNAAMACTVAVEEVIMDHYQEQISLLSQSDKEKYANLIKVLEKLRDEEIHHRDTGIEHDAYKTPLYELYSAIIRSGCKVAIKIAEKV